MYSRILVAYDGSEGARAALTQGIALAQALSAELCCLLVEEHLPHYAASISEVKGAKEQIDEHFRALAKNARDLAALSGVDMETIVRQGHEVETIVTTAKDGQFQLLVMFRSFREAGFLRSSEHHGPTALFGGITRMVELDREAIAASFRTVMQDIKTGGFARRFQEEARRNYPMLSMAREMVRGTSPMTEAETSLGGLTASTQSPLRP